MGTDAINIAGIISSFGVDANTAKTVASKMNGVDYLNLVNAVDDDSPNGRTTALKILSKYGIKIDKVEQMDNTRLESIFDGVRSGKDFDEAADMQFVRPISEMESLAAKMSGYSNFVRAANDTDADVLRDWLEENEFDYQNNDKHTFLVQSADRDHAYRLNRFMSKLTGKTSVMDSDNEENIMEKKPNRIKVDAPATRNPVAAGIVKKSGGGAHNSKDPSRKDAWSRNAKHKKSNTYESAFSQGETVQFEGADCQVQIPAGPNGTVGLLIDGKVRMVRESDVSRIDEGVLGMTKVDPLYRLRELAGVKSSGKPAIVEDDFGTVDPAMDDLEVADDFDDAMAPEVGADMGMDDTADLGGMDDMGMDDMGGMDAGLGAGDDLGMGGDMGMDDGEFASDMGGMPGDIGGAPVDAMGTMPVNSDAYNQIQDHLNNIQTSLGDVKLSEYRSLIAKLEALTVQIRSMGRDYLGEARKLKK